jgi:hypothetical protein
MWGQQSAWSCHWCQVTPALHVWHAGVVHYQLEPGWHWAESAAGLPVEHRLTGMLRCVHLSFAIRCWMGGRTTPFPKQPTSRRGGRAMWRLPNCYGVLQVCTGLGLFASQATLQL